MTSLHWQHPCVCLISADLHAKWGPKAAMNLDKGPLPLTFSAVISVKAQISSSGDMTAISVFLIQMALGDEPSKLCGSCTAQFEDLDTAGSKIGCIGCIVYRCYFWREIWIQWEVKSAVCSAKRVLNFWSYPWSLWIKKYTGDWQGYSQFCYQLYPETRARTEPN